MQTISTVEFEKRVEMEFGFLTYMHHMSAEKARKQAPRHSEIVLLIDKVL